MIARAVASIEEYRLGLLPDQCTDKSSIGILLSSLGEASEVPSPILSLISRVRHFYADDVVDFVKELSQPLPIAILRKTLQHLTDRHRYQESSLAAVRTVFGWYLQCLMQDPAFETSQLADITLLNKRGDWKLGKELAVGAQNVDAKWLLADDLAELLGSLASASRTATSVVGRGAVRHAAGSDPEHVAQLRAYWRRWDTVVSMEVVGGFLTLFGGQAEIVEMAQEFLGPNRSVNLVRDRLGMRYRVGSTGRGGTPVRDIDLQRMRFAFVDAAAGETVEIANLVGDPIHVELSRDVETVFVGHIGSTYGGENPTNVATFRSFDFSDYTRKQLIEILVQSASYLLSEVYWVVADALEEVFSELDESEQLDLPVAQSLIADHLLFYFSQLKGQSPRLNEFTKRWSSLRHQRAEEELHFQRSGEADQGLLALMRDLRVCLSTDEGIQAELLESVRAKIREYQYSPQSIPFELFQNADDAVVELEEMAGEVVAGAHRLALRCKPGGFQVLHGGRPVNKFRTGGWTAQRGRDRGFDRDLEKMLVMSSSDKPLSDGRLTGKFGLGFKSVLLASRQPKVLSQRLAFAVVGGMYPINLDGESIDRLRTAAAETELVAATATVTEVTLEPTESVLAIVKPFVDVLPVLLAFARRIKHCTMFDTVTGRKDIAWHATNLPGCGRAKVGSFSGEVGWPPFALLVDGGEDGALLLGVAPSGVVGLPPHVPSLWVTSPTGEKCRAGFAVNGRFDVDVGRSRLAAAAANEQVAAQLGRRLRVGFEEVYAASEAWEEFADSLRLSASSTRDGFWTSVWNVFENLRRGDAGANVLFEVVWGTSGAYCDLILDRRLVPTGLPGHFDAPCALRNLKWIFDDVVSSPEVLDEIVHWPVVVDRAPAGTAVSTRIGTTLKELKIGPRPLKIVSFVTLLEWELSTKANSRIDAQDAARLGRVFSRDAINDLPNVVAEEQSRIRAVLSDLLFQTETVEWAPAADLLISPEVGGDPEEGLRASFAPPNRLLNKVYDEFGSSFFLACRHRIGPTAKVLSEWAAAAKGDSRRAFLRYLLEGELRAQVGALLRTGPSTGWLAQLREDPILESFEVHERLIILGMLGFGASGTVTPEPPPGRDPINPVDPVALHAWWIANQTEYLPKYLNRVYPDGECFVKDSEYSGKQSEREAWLALFLLGMCQTIGRTSLEQNRDFIRLCRKEGLLETLAQAEDTPADWLKALDYAVEKNAQHLEYYHWMKHFVGAYLVGRRLDTYVQAFLAINQLRRPFSLGQVTAPRTAEFFQSGGPDAPPIGSVLRSGALFLMRELARVGVITNPHADRFSYLPTLGARRVVRAMSGPDLEGVPMEPTEMSGRIHQFLVESLNDPEAARFSDCFDIPLQIIDGDPDLQLELLKRTFEPQQPDPDWTSYAPPEINGD